MPVCRSTCRQGRLFGPLLSLLLMLLLLHVRAFEALGATESVFYARVRCEHQRVCMLWVLTTPTHTNTDRVSCSDDDMMYMQCTSKYVYHDQFYGRIRLRRCLHQCWFVEPRSEEHRVPLGLHRV